MECEVDEVIRLPGEGQKIDRIVEAFAHSYKRQHPFSPCKSQDAVHILAYALILLNSNIWNPNVREKDRMSFRSFKRQVEGQNDGEDFSEEWLKMIFDSIAYQEIKLSSEDPNAELSEGYWANVAITSRQERMRPVNSSGQGQEQGFKLDAFTCDMFILSWATMLQAIHSVLEGSAEGSEGEVAITQWCMRGLGTMGKLALQYNMPEVVDAVMVVLAGYIQMLHIRPPPKAILTFNNSLKAKEAFKLMYKELVHKCGDQIEQGWRQIVDGMVMLVKLEIWSGSVLRVVGFVEGGGDGGGGGKQSNRRYSYQLKRIGSAHSNLSQHWASGLLMNDGDERDDDQVMEEALQSCKRLVDECRISDILSDSKFLSEPALLHFVNAAVLYGLSANAQPRHTARTIQTQCICMDILLNIVVRNLDRAMVVWPHVSQYSLQLIMTRAKDDDCVTLIEKGIVSLFVIFQRLIPNFAGDLEASEKLFSVLEQFSALDFQAFCDLVSIMNGQLQSLISMVGAYVRTSRQWQIICNLIRLQFASGSSSHQKQEVVRTLMLIVGDSKEGGEGGGQFLNGLNFEACASLCKELILDCKGDESNVRQVQELLQQVMEQLRSWLLKQQQGGDVLDLEGLWTLLVLQEGEMVRKSKMHLVRTSAIAGIQDLLLHTGKIQPSSAALFTVFTTGIINTLETLINETAPPPNSNNSNNNGDNTNMDALTLFIRAVSASFLAHLDTLKTDSENLRELWIKMLDMFSTCMRLKNERLGNIVLGEIKKMLQTMIVQKQVLNKEWTDSQGKSVWEESMRIVNDISVDLVVDQLVGVLDHNDNVE
eukprot:TRINITY_DN1937_c0_g2_i3.p1 TRINITY_DN1937_c0_g2~~TRINITY_DN1937_c0_g2_i3.p1  ORF type:complete len:927 (-),score=181.77 TRINITY_DN1937_c0_g2_i3:380-2842(-)